MAWPTTFPHVSTGATLVSWCSLDLGYADDRINIQENPYFENIQNDAFGGAAGMPSDVHYLGSIAIVTCNLNRFTAANLIALADLDCTDTNTEGTMTDMGTFVIQDGMYGILNLTSKNKSLRYPYSFLRQGRRFNMGVRHQVYSLTFECHIYDPCQMILFSAPAVANPCDSS